MRHSRSRLISDFISFSENEFNDFIKIQGCIMAAILSLSEQRFTYHKFQTRNSSIQKLFSRNRTVLYSKNSRAMSPVMPLMKILTTYSMMWLKGAALCFSQLRVQKSTKIETELENFSFFREPRCSQHPQVSILSQVSILLS